MTKELISNIIERYISGKWAVFNFEIIEMVHEREVRTIRGPIPAGYDVNKVKKYEHIRDTKEIGKKLKDDFKVGKYRYEYEHLQCEEYYSFQERTGWFGFWRRPPSIMIYFYYESKKYKLIISKVK